MTLQSQVILIVEMRIDHFICELQQALEELGAETMVARDPARAIELLQSREFDLVVLGVLVPETTTMTDRLLNYIAPLPHVFYGRNTSVPTVVQACVDMHKG